MWSIVDEIVDERKTGALAPVFFGLLIDRRCWTDFAYLRDYLFSLSLVTGLGQFGAQFLDFVLAVPSAFDLAVALTCHENLLGKFSYPFYRMGRRNCQGAY